MHVGHLSRRTQATALIGGADVTEADGVLRLELELGDRAGTELKTAWAADGNEGSATERRGLASRCGGWERERERSVESGSSKQQQQQQQEEEAGPSPPPAYKQWQHGTTARKTLPPRHGCKHSGDEASEADAKASAAQSSDIGAEGRSSRTDGLRAASSVPLSPLTPRGSVRADVAGEKHKTSCGGGHNGKVRECVRWARRRVLPRGERTAMMEGTRGGARGKRRTTLPSRGQALDGTDAVSAGRQQRRAEWKGGERDAAGRLGVSCF
ncbi:unnamed protein product [Lampetra fluviatilis]